MNGYERTGRCAWLATMLRIEGFDHRLGAQHIAMNKKYTGDLAPISNILPWRSKAPGCAPGMKRKWVNCKENKEDVKWNFPKAKPTDKQKRQIEARVVEIAVRFLFENFTYRFGGKVYLQQQGGPIGARNTMAYHSW